jgi:hypothetical protein
MLIFSYVGFITKKVESKDSNLEVTLEEDLLGLDEVTVVAYGTQKKQVLLLLLLVLTQRNYVSLLVI